MVNWQTRDKQPPRNRPLIAFCPRWCDTGYQVCEWDGKEFYYTDQPNESFNECVVKWAMFLPVE